MRVSNVGGLTHRSIWVAPTTTTWPRPSQLQNPSADLRAWTIQADQAGPCPARVAVRSNCTPHCESGSRALSIAAVTYTSNRAKHRSLSLVVPPGGHVHSPWPGNAPNVRVPFGNHPARGSTLTVWLADRDRLRWRQCPVALFDVSKPPRHFRSASVAVRRGFQ